MTIGPWLTGGRGPGAFVGSAGEGDGGFEEPPTVIDINGDVTIHGKVKPGSFGKFVYPLTAVATGRKYTFRAVANFSQLAQQGKLAMVGFGFKNGNDFHIDGLRGDGSTGTKEYIVHGTPPNGWNKQTGHTEVDNGTAGAGTQHSAYYQLTTSSDGSTYILKTSTDGVTYTTVVTGQALTPFSNISGVVTFGVALWFNNADAGPFTITITAFADEVGGDPNWANVFFQSDFEGTNNQQTSFLDDTGVWTLSRGAGAGKLSSTQKLYGSTAAYTDSNAQGWLTGTSTNWNFSTANSDAYTWEFGFYKETALATMDLHVIDTAGGSINTWVRINDTGEVRYLGSKTGSGFPVDITTSGAGITANAFFKICIEKNTSGTIRIYVNGVMKAKSTPADSVLFSNSGLRLKIGEGGGQAPQNVYTDAMRITKGVARYNSDAGYTPDTAAFTIG